MTINSRQKGACGERELARALGDVLGVELRRGQQFCGLAGNADVIGVDGLHLEVKRTEKLQLYPAMKQATRDAKPGCVPVVAHRRNREGWLLCVRLEDVIEFARRIASATENQDVRHESAVS
jgi:Holliday junction resolvase